MWDREFSFHTGFSFDFTLEVGHAAYYRIVGDLTFFKFGFGFKDILIEERPLHYC